MDTCRTCGDPTDDGAEYCSAACFWTAEAEEGRPLDGTADDE